MGLYADIQKDISEAFDNDLSDAVKSVEIIHETISDYNTTTGAPVVESLSYDTRGVVIDNNSERGSDNTLSEGEIEILILDSEKEVDKFIIGMDAVIGDDIYEIKGIMIDPAGATHTLKCRPKNAGN